MVIYVWSILEGIVPNFNENQKGSIQRKEHVRHGRKCVVPIIKRSAYTSIINASFRVHGAKLFNAMPRCIRNLTGCTKDVLKTELDKVLLRIPDEPQIRRYTAYRRADSNSILDMINHSVGLNELDM